MSQQELIPFGKYKGQPLEILQQDKQYFDWLMAQPWFREKYPQYQTLIINNFQEPSETPEHNKLQALFLDENLCYDFIEEIKDCIQDTYTRKNGHIYTLDKESIEIIDIIFEDAGVDVVLRIEGCFHEESGLHKVKDAGCIPIEIKPTLSDDFPAVLRQMKSNNSKYLLIESFTAKGATLKQVRQMFSSSDKYIVLLSDIK